MTSATEIYDQSDLPAVIDGMKWARLEEAGGCEWIVESIQSNDTSIEMAIEEYEKLADSIRDCMLGVVEEARAVLMKMKIEGLQ